MNPANILTQFGAFIIFFLEEFGKFFIFFSQVVRWTWITASNWTRYVLDALFRRPRPRLLDFRETVEQMVQAGVKSVPVAMVTAMFTGMVMALQTGLTLERKMAGISQYLGGMVSVTMLRELGPVLTALIVTGRVGSAMAAEIGSMRVTEQVDALETLATNPVKYLVVPRAIAMVCMLPILTVFADIVGVLGGGLVAHFRFGQSVSMYIDNGLQIVVMGDLFSGLTKTFFFGAIIACVSCYKGFLAEGGAEGVGKATTSAVVISSMGILVADYLLTASMSVF